MCVLIDLCLFFFAFVLTGILAGEAAPKPNCGSFETVCCDGEITEQGPSIGDLVHGCSQCGFPLHGSPDSKQKKPPPPPSSKSGFFISIQTGRAKSLTLSSSLTEIYRQMAKFKSANIRRRGGAAVHSW